MTVIEDAQDNVGRSPLIFKGYKNLEEVHSWLFQNYNGYHFCIMLNETRDEYEPFGKELYVYFSDEALEEIATYSGKKVVKE